jgi:hypothetical protein
MEGVKTSLKFIVERDFAVFLTFPPVIFLFKDQK